tara:strand:+ start:671 stop:832 length:162 start_codon:yes stop_codon:yes gene_type:complete
MRRRLEGGQEGGQDESILRLEILTLEILGLEILGLEIPRRGILRRDSSSVRLL